MPKVVREADGFVAVLYVEGDEGGPRVEIARRGKEQETGGCLRIAFDEMAAVLVCLAYANGEIPRPQPRESDD